MLVLGQAGLCDYPVIMVQIARDTGDARPAELARLTEREKDCLRRILRHETAKEMAIDMGVSPHAIEKRLKMARAKLGVSSSLQAARLLAASEGYQETGPQLPDVDKDRVEAKTRHRRTLAIGVCLMSIAAVALYAGALTTVAPATEPGVIPKPGEIVLSGPSTFDELDKDRSGFLDGNEAPALALFGGDATYESLPDGRASVSGDYVRLVDGKALRDRFYREADGDGDGRVSRSEFGRWATAGAEQQRSGSASGQGNH